MRIFRNGYDITTIGVDLSKVETFNQLRALEFSQPIVFTVGCFDLFHAGHVHLLREAHYLGARLIVGLDTDESVKKLKGDARPFYPFAERLDILLACKFVDYVIEGSTDEWPEVMQALKPTTFVKGAEYRNSPCKLGELAQNVKYIEMCGDLHTTRIIDVVRTTNGHYGPRRCKVSKNAD